MLRRRRRPRRTPRLKGQTFSKIVPNAITVAATCAGLSGIRFAIEGRWEFAAGAILIAAILDTLDGRMARLLKASSDFGAELDSLSDFVAFGVAPAMISYFWLLDSLGGIGWGVALFFSVCMGLRLARFNSSLDKLPSYAYNYFQGVPAPAGAGLALLPLLLTFEIPELSQYIPPAFQAIWMIAVALLLVSNLPTFSFKKMKVPSHLMVPAMAGCALAVAFLVGRPWATMSVVLITYLVSFPFSFRSYSKLKAEAELIQGLDDDGDEEASPPENPETTSGDQENGKAHLRSVE